MTIEVINCPQCNGKTSSDYPCSRCHQYGKRRAQRVITVVNVDTGAVASSSLVPGGIKPLPSYNNVWWVNLAPIIQELAESVGAKSVFDVSHLDQPIDTQKIIPLVLPLTWRPDLTENERASIEAEKLAEPTARPWQVYCGWNAPFTPVDIRHALKRLCHLANMLHVDLVVEARRRRNEEHLTWDIRFDLPGGGVPSHPRGNQRTLSLALTHTEPEIALRNITNRATYAPAHWIVPTDTPPEPPLIDPGEIEKEIVRISTVHSAMSDTVGAHGIWREGQWYYTTLRKPGATVIRGYEPPPPSWLGQLIPYTLCTHHEGRECINTDDNDDNELWKNIAADQCERCHGTRRLYSGAVLTITNLADRVDHVNWHAEPGLSSRVVATHQGGVRIVQLPEHFQVASWAAAYGVRISDLTDLTTDRIIDHDLRYGYVMLNGYEDDPSSEYCRQVTRGRHGARLFVKAAPVDTIPLGYLIRIVRGLGLGINITVESHRLNQGNPIHVQGESWVITVTAPGRDDTKIDHPVYPNGATAIRECLENLNHFIGSAVPHDPSEPIPTPETPGGPVEEEIEGDLATLISGLGDRYAGQRVLVRRDPSGWHIHLGTAPTAGSPHHASGPSLLDAIMALPPVSARATLPL